jgi:hypothetical protein
MTPRALEVIKYIRRHGLSVHASFGPLRRGEVRPFIGGGTVTEAEYRAILAELYVPAQNVDGAEEARRRARGAAAKWH